MKEINRKMDAHAVEKYIPIIVEAFKTGWPVLLGVFGLAGILSTLYLMVIECFAGPVVWSGIVCMMVIPAIAGSMLIYASTHGGIDGMPGSGDDGTDLGLGIFLCVLAAVFTCICFCMSQAIARSIRVVEAAAACLVSCQSLLLEPFINLTARITVWLVFGWSLVYLISVGEVNRRTIYRSFSYTTAESIYLVFHVFMWIWVNEFLTACSIYSVANAAGRWYFTPNVGGEKNVPMCALCRGYCNILFHYGSLAFGSCIIAFTRPVRLVMLCLVYAGDVTDNATCGCVTYVCGCCVTCFENLLQHICKTAFIDMAITSKPFCAAGGDAADLLKKKNTAGQQAILVNYGATWLFTIGGMGTVTILGAFITSCIVTNIDVFAHPSSKYYIVDPMVITMIAGLICFIVSLAFMIVFDAIADSLFLCMAHDQEELRSNPVPKWKPPAREPQSYFSSMLTSEKLINAPEAVHRPDFAIEKLKDLYGNLE
jgi:hypothetical protein